MKQRICTALAHLCNEEDRRAIFAGVGPGAALEVLLDMLTAPASTNTQQKEAAHALTALASTAAPPDFAPAPPRKEVYLGDENVNNSRFSDVTFVVDGQPFYAHKIALLNSSDAFRAMFDGGYKEKEAQHIAIPNISHTVWDAMMRCIYTGTVDVAPEIAHDLLRAADQYLLEMLKPLCENVIGADLAVVNVADVFELAETYHAPQLMNMCVRYALENYNEMVEVRGVDGYRELLSRMRPQLTTYLRSVGTGTASQKPPADPSTAALAAGADATATAVTPTAAVTLAAVASNAAVTATAEASATAALVAEDAPPTANADPAS